MENAREEYKVVYQRISYYKNNSFDVSFHNYLDSMIIEVANSARTPQEFLNELDANYQKYLQIVADNNKEKKAEKNKKIEYSLGVGVLSVFGIAFILYGLFSFGKEYITDTVLMIILYVLSAGVITFSELALSKKHESISHLVTCIGFSLAYFTTFYSYSARGVLNTVAVAVLVLVISALAVVLNRLRNSELIEIVVGLGVACVALPFMRGGEVFDFVLWGALIAVVNAVFYVITAKRPKEVAEIIRAITMIIAGLCLIGSSDYSEITFWYKGGLCICYALVYTMGYIVNRDNEIGRKTCLISVFIFCTFLIGSGEKSLPVFAASVLGVGIISLILFLYNKADDKKWTGYILFMSFVVLKSCTVGNEAVTILVVLAAILISKLVAYIDNGVVDVYDCVLTGFALLVTLRYYENPLVYTIAAVAIIGCFLAKRFRLYHVIFTCITMICFSFLNDALWLSVSFMVVALLLIGYGCYINKFEVRLSGLILSLIVCLKVSLFDFRKADDFRRLIVFLVVGTIAIAISILYLYLEKREREQSERQMETFSFETKDNELHEEMREDTESVSEETNDDTKDVSEGDSLDA